MKKLLILAYDFPPYVSVGGLRPYSWYRYMKGFGVEPIVVTRQWENKYGNELDYISPSASKETIIEKTEYGTIIRTPYRANLSNRLLLKYGKERFKLIRKFITAYYEIAHFFFFVGTKSGLYRGAKEYLKSNKVDCIIATGAPHILFKYASKLSKKHNVPWIADYRDPWTQSKTRNKNKLIKSLNLFFERSFLKNVATVTTVSDFIKDIIGENLKNKSIYIITNGYNPENIPSSLTKSKKLSFSYVGSIYAWHPLNSVLEVFSRAVEIENIDFVVSFYGTNKSFFIESEIEKKYPSLKDKVFLYDKMDNKALLKKLNSSDVLILFNDYIISGTKIYDYLALKKYILLCYDEMNHGNSTIIPYKEEILSEKYEFVQKSIIERCRVGHVAKNPKDFYNQIKILYKQYIESGEIYVSDINTEEYSRKYQTQKLVELILNI